MKKDNRFRAFVGRSGLLLALILLFVILASVAPNFLSARNMPVPPRSQPPLAKLL